MDYQELIDSHEKFQMTDRGYLYNVYIKNRSEEEWRSGDVSVEEVEKLFHFVRSWERHFRGDPSTFKKIYDGNYLAAQSLRLETLENADLEKPDLRMKIRHLFDMVASCTFERRYESTDSSIILHTILPGIFVSWNDSVKKGTKIESRGASYSGAFLPAMQKEVREAIVSCMRDKKISRLEAISFIRGKCGGMTLAKLVDENNYLNPPKNIDVFLLNRHLAPRNFKMDM